MTPQPTAAAGLYDSDKALAEAISSKDRKASAEFVQIHADAVYTYVLSRLRPNIADAEDLTQEVFLAACRSIAEYRASSSLRAWILGIARHKVEDYYRARVRPADLEEAVTLPDSTTHLDSALDQNRLRDQVVTVLDQLPEPHRLLLKWKYWDQKATAEIAAVLGRTEKAIERMLARARERFRREWESKHE